MNLVKFTAIMDINTQHEVSKMLHEKNFQSNICEDTYQSRCHYKQCILTLIHF